MTPASTRPFHTKANLFMLFLLSFNVLLTTTIGSLYWEFWHGTPIGEYLRSPWWLVVTQVVGLLLPMFIFSILAGPPPFTAKKEPLGLVNVVLVVVISLLLQPVMMLISALASLILPNPVTGLMTELAVIPLPTALIIIALTPAICEELVFRGFIQSRYQEQPIAITAVVNGLFFGIIHLNLHQFTYAFVMGIVFVFMVYITKSILSAIVAHFVVNASQYSLSYLALREHGPVTGPPEGYELWEAIGELATLAFFTLPLVVGLFYALVKYNAWRKPQQEDVAGETEKPEECPKHSHPFDVPFWAVLFIFFVIVVLF